MHCFLILDKNNAYLIIHKNIEEFPKNVEQVTYVHLGAIEAFPSNLRLIGPVQMHWFYILGKTHEDIFYYVISFTRDTISKLKCQNIFLESTIFL